MAAKILNFISSELVAQQLTRQQVADNPIAVADFGTYLTFWSKFSRLKMLLFVSGAALTVGATTTELQEILEDKNVGLIFFLCHCVENLENFYFSYRLWKDKRKFWLY